MTVTDLSWVTSRLAVGAAPTSPQQLRQLAAAGVTHVLDLSDDPARRDLFADLPELARLQYSWNPIPDNDDLKPVEWFHRSLAFSLRVLARRRTRLLLCCQSGVDRAPSTAYAVLRAVGFSESQAEQLIRRRRPVAELGYRLDAEAAVLQLGYTGGAAT